jgi:hypothetical protein
MVRLYGPLMSLDASGTIADAVTFSKWKGRNYARQRVIPANPQSVLQVAVRSMMKFLAQAWTDCTALEKASWDDLAKATSISAFNAYISDNMKRWRQMLAPSALTPPAGTGTLQASGAASAVGGYRQAVITFPIAGVNDGWGIAIERNTVDVYRGTLDAIVGAIPTPAAAATLFTDVGLTPGTYYYYWRRFTRAGKLDGPFAQGSLSAVVT